MVVTGFWLQLAMASSRPATSQDPRSQEVAELLALLEDEKRKNVELTRRVQAIECPQADETSATHDTLLEQQVSDTQQEVGSYNIPLGC